jgi:V8-like Glu-specific endopeptidase
LSAIRAAASKKESPRGHCVEAPRWSYRVALSIAAGIDERARILDTDLSPWRIIRALRMHAATGPGAIGTGWVIGPKSAVIASTVHFSLALSEEGAG